MTRALELAARTVRAADGDGAEAFALAERSGFARFAASEVHQPTLIENEGVHLRVARDGRVGAAATNVVSDEGLRALAARAREAAERAPRDRDFEGFASGETVADVPGFDPETAEVDAAEQAECAAKMIDAVSGFGVYGFFTTGTTDLAVATSAGQAVEQRLTDATAFALAADEDASGYAEQTSWAVGELDPAAVAREAAEIAAKTRGPVVLEPGSYRAVLQPAAVADLLQYFAFDTFGGLGLLEDRSYASGRLGDRVFDRRISLADDALDPAGLPKAFDFEGRPKQRVELVEDGVLRGVVWDTAAAARADGARSTGHAPPPSLRQWGPLPFALSLAGGEAASVDDLVDAVDDGIYVTCLHYLGVVEEREGVITGMTRDGTFRIRGGRIAEPLLNLRFTVAMPELLADVPALTRTRTLVNQSHFYDDRYPYGSLVPALATARFDVTGIGGGPGV